jgi:hypothetical protein
VWEEVAQRHPIRALRWVLVHLHVASPADLARIRRLGVGATTNPISYLWRSGAAEAERAGTDTMIPHRSLARLGIPFGIATDNKPADPWLAFRASVERRDMATGALLGPGERLTRAQALRAFTLGGAWLAYAERERGMLAPGRLADLCAFDQDPLTMPLADVEALDCRLTMVGGDIVHGDG